MRSIHPALRATATVALVAALCAGLAGTAQAGGSKSKKPVKPGTLTTTSTYLTASGIRSVHDTVCPTVAEYTKCANLTVTVSDQGSTGYTATSAPASGSVSYNSSVPQTSAGWSRTVSHEVGGHHDAWNELVAKVGTTQAWTDYYDLDYFGELWAEARYKAVKGTTKDVSRSQGKEVWLDCVGPNAHGYPGNYLSGLGLAEGSEQTTFCQGASTVMSDAITKVRPS